MANAKHPDEPWSSREHVFPKEKPVRHAKSAAHDEDDEPAAGALRAGAHRVRSRTK